MKFYGRKIKLSAKYLLLSLLIAGWIFSGWPPIWQNPRIPPKIQEVFAANYLTNPSFTGGSTGWTLTTTIYDSAYYQDTAGSAKTATAVGRNTAGTGSAAQTISTNIEAGSTVLLSHYWSKQCVAVNCAINTIQVDIAKPSAPTTWVTIWSDTSIPAYGSATSWTGPSNLNVSANFNETGQYIFRTYANLKNGNNASAQSLAWFDNINLNVTPPNITVGATGIQTLNMNVNSTNNYVGGAFTFIRNSGTANVTQIIITDQGTVNANLNLSNVDIYYETAATCSYEGTETLFGTAASFNASEKATVIGTMAIGTSQVCVYVVLDVGSGAAANETIEIEISNPSTEVTVSAGTVTPATAVAITGTTTLLLVVVSVSVSDGVVSYGTIAANSTKSTCDLSDTQIATNNGNVTETFNIKGQNSANWTLGATAGSDQYVHKFTTSTCPWVSGAALTTSYQTMSTGVAPSGTATLNLQVNTPNPSSVYTQQSVDVIIQAVQ